MMLHEGLILLAWTSGLAAAAVVPALLYLGLLALLSGRRAGPAPVPGAALPRLAMLVPAHNEAAQIEATVRSLQAVDYPAGRIEVVVVADNCTDATAGVAAAAGATVLERQHATERGKGYALHFAFGLLLARPSPERPDAVAVIDADSIVSGNFAQALAARLQRGAWAIQAEYGVRNPLASWRTRLMAIALGMFHRVRGLGRERLGLSAGLRGNGMCFSAACLERFEHNAHSLVEDVEYGIALGMGGVRIAYADEAHVLGEMVSGAADSESQRRRWEDGRRLLRALVPRLLRDAVARRSALLLDLALDLAIPPLGTLGVALVLGLGLEGARVWLGGAPGALSAAWAMGALALALYVGRGMALSGLGFGAMTTMAYAPVYVAWKLALKLRGGKRTTDWVRTAREQHKSD